METQGKPNFCWINEAEEKSKRTSVGVKFASPDLIKLQDAIQNLPNYAELALHNEAKLECQTMILVIQNIRQIFANVRI